MSLDHYVSQVHLKNFYSPVLGDLFYAIRKGDLKTFTANSKAVCRIEEGSTNLYLSEERAIEEFLKGIEPKYNAVISKVSSGEIDVECIYVIAGFVAYVLTCSPAGMRIQSDPLKNMVEVTANILESQGSIPPPPTELGGDSLTDLLSSGKVRVDIDPKYPQAIGISSILSLTSMFGNFAWDILINTVDDSPFFTSDFPIAIEQTNDPRILNRIVPLSPNIAIRIKPNISQADVANDFSFSGFKSSTRKISRQEVISINKLIVRCAETILFYRDNQKWIPGFVKKNAKFRIEPRTHKISHNKGKLLWSTLEVVEMGNENFDT